MGVEIPQDDGVVLGAQEGLKVGSEVGWAGGYGGDVYIVDIDGEVVNCG